MRLETFTATRLPSPYRVTELSSRSTDSGGGRFSSRALRPVPQHGNLGGNSIIYMLEGQIGYALRAIQALAAGRLAWLDVRSDVQDAFNSWVQSASRKSVWESGCHSWYTTPSGRNTNNWPSYTFMYRYRVRRFDLAAYRSRERVTASA